MTATARPSPGAERAFRDLFARYQGPIHSYVRRLERDLEDVEEIVADVFMLAFQHIDELSTLHEQQVRSWLYRTATPLGANRSRRKIRFRGLVERLLHEPPDVAGVDELLAAEAAADGTRDARIAAVLAAMADQHREVLVATANGRTGPQLATMLGISASAARKRLMHARIEFRTVWHQLFPADRADVPQVPADENADQSADRDADRDAGWDPDRSRR